MNLRERLPNLGDVITYYDGVNHYPNWTVSIAWWNDSRDEIGPSFRLRNHHTGQLDDVDLLLDLDHWYYVSFAKVTAGNTVSYVRWKDGKKI